MLFGALKGKEHSGDLDVHHDTEISFFNLCTVIAQPDGPEGICHEEHGRCIRDAQFQNCKLQEFSVTYRKNMQARGIISQLEMK